MQEHFDRTLVSLGLRRSVLLAVSGGLDSMVMADLFLHSPVHLDFAVAHCNFHLRGKEGDLDEALVREWADAHGVVFLKKDFETAGYARSKGVSIEMAARELRYGWFASLCREEGYSALAVAHNANDNAETLILNLLRGTGVQGMTGMKVKAPLAGAPEIALVRPLLQSSRTEIHEYAVAHGLSWREDKSNADPAYKRNLIRNEVFPLFERLNPAFLKTLGEDAVRFAQVQKVADSYYGKVEAGIVSLPGGDGTVVIARKPLLAAEHWEYVLYRALAPLGFKAAVVDEMASLLKKGLTSGKRFLSDSHLAVTTGEEILISRLPLSAGPDAARQGESLVIDRPGKYEFGGTLFFVETIDAGELKQAEGTTVMNLGYPFAIRHWRKGDWMRPLGMNGRKKKLSDMFVDLKFNLLDKEKALVVAAGGSHVVAILGYRIDESIAARPGAQVVRIVLE